MEIVCAVTEFVIDQATNMFILCSLPKDTQPGLLREKTGAKKLMDLGLDFIPMDQIIKDAVESLKSKGFFS
jgi:hypothetical protein